MGNKQTCFQPKDVRRRSVMDTSPPPELPRVKGRKSTAGLTDRERKKMFDSLARQQSRLAGPRKSLPPEIGTTSEASSEERNIHFVLVHGGGFGAWCWYKIIALMQQTGFKVHALDMAGGGIQPSNPNDIASIEHYAKPLITYLHTLNSRERVILVGHDLGGVCVSYAMELFPSKVEKSVFVAAAMPVSGLSILDIFQPSAQSHESRGRKPPAAIQLEKTSLKDTFFNRTPQKDIALASAFMRAVPFGPLTEKLSLSGMNYGSVRRFYIRTDDDRRIPPLLQEAVICSNPPERVFQLKGSDHSPFFSKPQGLHRLLVHISAMESLPFVPARRSSVL